MRVLKAKEVEDAVRDACIDACRNGSEDLVNALKRAREAEESVVGKMVLERLLDNLEIARDQKLPICQDTGLAVMFVERGEELAVDGHGLAESLTRGVRRGYEDGYLRKSVCQPLTRSNTGDNTPVIIHTEVVPGDGLKISLMAKGGGSENMSGLAMLKPAQGWDAIREFVVDTVSKAGANPCPPVIVGVGVGGNFEMAAINSKKALLRPLDEFNSDADLHAREDELLEAINQLGIGPQGYGGRVTALGVSLIMAPCHLASLPVAVNIQCHANRHREITL